MPKDPNIQFLPSVKETFDPLFDEYGFKLENEMAWDGRGESTVTASKADISLVFYLGSSPLFYDCDLGIKLSGALAKKATDDVHYHSLSIMAIAGCLDPAYKPPRKGIQSQEDLKEALERVKADLLKYGGGILSGDVSAWPEVVRCLQEKLKKSGLKIQGRS